MNKVLLIDGNALLYRAYFATGYDHSKILRTVKGFPTNAVVAFYNMLKSALAKTKATHVFVAFDAGKSTFRHASYSDYKGDRKPTPEDLIKQFPVTKEMLTNLGIKHFELAGYEADDIIATFCESIKEDYEVIILSSDNDLLQLVDKNVTVLQPKKGIKILQKVNLDNFFELFNYYPHQAVDYKALVGDPSDNIKGINKVGPKTAINLLTKFQNLNNLYKNLDKLPKSKVSESIKSSEKDVYKWKQLITLVKDIEIPLRIDDIKINREFSNINLDFFQKYELNKVYKEMLSKTLNLKDRIMENINQKLIKINQKNLLKNIYLHFFLDSHNYHVANILGVGIMKEGKFLFFNDIKDPELKTILNSNIPKIVFNYKKIKYICNKHNLKIVNFEDDLLIMYYVLNPSLGNNIEKIANWKKLFLYSENNVLTNRYIRKIKKVGDFKFLLEYQVKILPILYQEGLIDLYQNNLNFVYKKIEKPYTNILYKAEKRGIKIKVDLFDKFSKKVKQNLELYLEKANSMGAKNINLSSSYQLVKWMYDDLQIKTSTRDTANSTLMQIKNSHPFVRILIEYRKWEKLNNTYVEGFRKFAIDNEIHTIFDQTGTETGRISSKFPNMQNLAAHNEDQKEFSKALVAREGYSFICADYSQIELRVFAHLANSKFLIEAFKNNLDIHTMNASRIFNLPIEKVDDFHRYRAKAVNFGIMYGQGAFGLSKQLGISYYQAKDIIDSYNLNFPEIENFKNKQVKKIFEEKKIETLLGRIRLVPSSGFDRKFYSRVAVNMPVQGTVADMIKLASIEIDKYLENDEANLVLQIHDELIFEVKNKFLNKYTKIIQNKMEKIVNLKVPTPVSVKIQENLYKN